MTVDAHTADGSLRARQSGWVFLAVAVAALVVGRQHAGLALVVLLAYLAGASVRWRVSTSTLYGLFVVAVMLVPAQYRLAARLPADMRAERVVLLLLLAAWAFGQLRTEHWVRPEEARQLDAPLLGFLVVAAFSFALNAQNSIAGGYLGADLKSLLLLCVFVATYYLTMRVVPGRRDAERVTAVAVASGGVAAASAVVERLAGFNPIAAALLAVPGVVRVRPDVLLARGSALRVMGTGEHPIAFGGVMAILLPPALYLAMSARGRARVAFSTASALIATAMLLSISRSALLAAAAGFAVLLASWPRKRRVLLTLALVAVIVVVVADPGLLATFGRTMNPKWVLQQESASYSSRLGDYPLVAEIVPRQPLFGVGWSGFDVARYVYLDNQLLKTLLEVGIVGLAFAAVFYARLAKLLWKASRSSAEIVSFEGALLASLAAFGVLSALFDTFGFSQIVYVFFILAALGVIAASERSALARDAVPEGEVEP